MNLNKLEICNLRFEKYNDIEYTLIVDDLTFAPIIVIKYPDGDVEEYKISRIDIEKNITKQMSFVEAMINSVIFKKMRKLKLDRLNKNE